MNRNHPALRPLVGCLLACGASAALAQQPRESPYAGCAQITDDRERLACFDRTFANEAKIVAQLAEAERKAEAEEFGLTPKQIREREERQAKRTGAVAADEAAAAPALATEDSKDGFKVTAAVTEVLTDALGNYVVILDNGQIWRSTANKSLRGSIRPGAQAEIVKIWSGGYRMTFKDRSGFLGVARMR